MDNELTQVENLIKLFEDRDRLIGELTFNIFDTIQHPILTSIIELCELSQNQVNWHDVQLVHGAMLLTCSITFIPSSSSSFIRKLFMDEAFDEIHTDITKSLRIGIPVTHTYRDKHEIKEFLNYVADKAYTERFGDTPISFPILIKDEEVLMFDNSTLTEDQLAQLNNFIPQGKGVH